MSSLLGKSRQSKCRFVRNNANHITQRAYELSLSSVHHNLIFQNDHEMDEPCDGLPDSPTMDVEFDEVGDYEDTNTFNAQDEAIHDADIHDADIQYEDIQFQDIQYDDLELNDDLIGCVEFMDSIAFGQEIDDPTIIEPEHIEHIDSPNEEWLSETLSLWSLSNNISISAVSSLLKILHSYHKELPIDGRTLLKSLKKIPGITQLGSGVYYHFTLLSQITHRILCNPLLRGKSGYQIKVNIDGMRIFKKDNKQFWPILCSIVGDDQPFIVSLYAGGGKPSSLDEFLNPFVNELLSMLKDGFDFEGHSKTLAIKCFTCDSPAAAWVLGVKGHSGYHGCRKCIQKGESYKRRVIFPESNAVLRTDESVVNKTHVQHHTSDTPLAKLKDFVGLCTDFPLDFMHLGCIGSLKKFLQMIELDEVLKISKEKYNEISQKLVALRKNIPEEFARKPRSLDEACYFKATEGREILLYTGMSIFKGSLPQPIYELFLLLCVGCRIMSDKALLSAQGSFADECLRSYVDYIKSHVSKEHITFNMHSLIHLYRDCMKHGPVEDWSAFEFENFLGWIRTLIRKPAFPLQQVIKRIHEHQVSQLKTAQNNAAVVINKSVPKPIRPDKKSPKLDMNLTDMTYYHKIKLEHFSIVCDNTADNCLLINDTICLAQNIIKSSEGYFVVYKHFRTMRSYFTQPCDSQHLGIHIVDDLSEELYCASVFDVKAKYVYIPRENLAMKLIHTGLEE